MTRRDFEGSSIQYDVHRYDVHRQPALRVGMRDGEHLVTEVYLPARSGRPVDARFPALVERTPYDRRRPFLVQTARYFARRGYAVVLQDVRGRFDSGGEWGFLSEIEADDGCDTLRWIAAQPWCDGQVGTMGLSFSTANQQALALRNPPALRAQVLLDGGYSYYHRTVRHAGAFELGVMLPYAYRTAREGHELARDPAARRRFEAEFADHERWMRCLPIRPGESPLRLAPSYERWFIEAQNHGDYDEFWKHPGWNVAEHVGRYPDVPIAMETSWYGHHVWATVTRFAELRRRHATPKLLVIGPWLHGYEDFGRTYAGDVDFGPDATLDLNDLRLRWYDQFLKGLDTGVLDEPPVRLFVMGGGSGRRNLDGRLEHGGHWRSEHEWPLARTRWTAWYLHPDGSLRPDGPPAASSPSRYTFDPANPVPTVGGGTQTPLLAGFIQGGGFDQRGRGDLWACRGDLRPLADRPDVLVFQTPPLAEDLEITGPLTVRLWASSSAVDTDFTAKLIDVYPPNEDYPDGYALNLTDGIIRARYRESWERPVPLAPGQIYAFTIEPQPTSNLFRAGHRIRIDISSSNFPRFDVNPNTGEPLGQHTHTVVARQAIYHDADRPSHVVLPGSGQVKLDHYLLPVVPRRSESSY